MDSVGYREWEHNYRIEIKRFWFFRSWGWGSTGFVRNMTEFVLNTPGLFLNMNGFVINNTVFFLFVTAFVPKNERKKKKKLFFQDITRFVLNSTWYVLNTTEFALN